MHYTLRKLETYPITCGSSSNGAVFIDLDRGFVYGLIREERWSISKVG